ncbi:MAG: exodeoxyribonuclease V subunit gamma [Propionibacteriaceae bacterium]|nr:exodeoxyribonuclease V subunit gamma [Propionibacteriaceae bacterium]
MALEVRHSSSWHALVASLTDWLAEDPPGVFETVTVVVSSRSVGRMLRQSLAASLPGAICAGVDFLTMPQWVQAAARRHSLAEDLQAWRSTRLQLAVAKALETMVEEDTSPVLSAHMGAQGSPARRMQLAGRLARLLRHYVEWAPGMVRDWLEDDDDPEDDDPRATDGAGQPLPVRLDWQPELLRLTAETLMVDPVETWEHLGAAVEADPADPRTAFFGLTEVPRSHVALIAAHGSSHDATIWRVDGTAFDDWTAPLDADRVLLENTVAPPPRVEVHGSHGPSRQVEVLRDELCRRFDADPTLEPRDVLVVCPEPADWWPHLRTAFAPLADDPQSHPGRTLRVQLGAGTEQNLVLHFVHHLLSLADERATASFITELVLLRPVAHRWRLENRRDQVTELVVAADVRWGLDERHRNVLGLGGVTQNTWMRGLDRLLAGLAMAPGSDALPITGVDTVGTSDLELVGTLSELVSRLRKFTHGSSSPATVDGWVARVREVLTELVGPSFDDEWMLLETHGVLTDLAEDLAHTDTQLSRAEFARLFQSAAHELTPRPAIGNGALQVVALGELQHVPFRLVCLLGVGDPATAGDADLVDLGGAAPDRRGIRQARLIAHARAGDDVLIVTQDRNGHTNEPMAEATTITALVRELGSEPRRTAHHPLHSHGEDNFTATKRPSYDRRALGAALALRNAAPDTPSPREQRRRAAIALRVPDGASASETEVSLDELHRFLKDPALTFLANAAAVRLFEKPRMKDELPLELNGLESWGVQDRLLRSLRAGLTPDAAATQEFQRESLPPKLIGKAMLSTPMKNAMELWRSAEKDMVGDVVERRVDLDLGGLRLQDTITTHGGQVVHVIASKGIKHEVLAWLQILALAAMGTPARAIVHRMDREGFFDVRARRELVAPPGDVALELLEVMGRGFSQGRHRLVPVPLEPALVYAGQLIGGTPDLRQWELPSRDWSSPWRFLPSQWQLFYGDNAAHELLSDKRSALDPPSEEVSAFGAWARALYVPMLRGGM